MSFRYVPQHDFVHATFDGCELSKSEDVARWDREVRARLATFGRKIDLVIGLDGLIVKAPVAREFGAARSAVLAEYSTHSVRYGGDRTTKTSILTSSVLQRTDANLFASYEEAVEELSRLRGKRSSSVRTSRPPLGGAGS